MMASISIPRYILPPKSVSLRLLNSGQVASQSLSGFRTVIDQPIQRWFYDVDWATLSKAQLQMLRPYVMQMHGMARTVSMPVYDATVPTDMELFGRPNAVHRFNNNGDLNEKFRWRSYDISGVNASFSKGVTRAVIIMTNLYAGKLQAGQFFNVGDDLYCATSVTYAGGLATVDFEPSARRTYTTARVRLRPFLTCRLTSPDALTEPVERAMNVSPSLSFEEVIT